MVTTKTEDPICRHLNDVITRPLPGRAAQLTMVPPGRTIPDRPPEIAREGAVLIAFLPTKTGYAIPLIERSDDGGPHAGQVAFPGGARETRDIFPEGTALREAEEEIGLPSTGLTVVGRLSPLYVSVSNFLITPVLACGNSFTSDIWDALVPDPQEAQRIIAADPFQLESTRAIRRVRARGNEYDVPSYRWDGDVIWGATAIILAEVLVLCH